MKITYLKQSFMNAITEDCFLDNIYIGTIFKDRNKKFYEFVRDINMPKVDKKLKEIFTCFNCTTLKGSKDFISKQIENHKQHLKDNEKLEIITQKLLQEVN